MPPIIRHRIYVQRYLDTNSSFDLPVGFAGGTPDDVTGLVRFGWRDYEPGAGRWTAKDPIIFNGGQANLFVYVANDPVNFTDPEGLFKGLMPGLSGSYGHMVGGVGGAVLGGAIGGTVGANVGMDIGFVIGGALGLGGGPLGSFGGAIVGGYVGGAVGGFVGGLIGGNIGGALVGGMFDPPYAGQLNYKEPMPLKGPCERK